MGRSEAWNSRAENESHSGPESAHSYRFPTMQIQSTISVLWVQENISFLVCTYSVNSWGGSNAGITVSTAINSVNGQSDCSNSKGGKLLLHNIYSWGNNVWRLVYKCLRENKGRSLAQRHSHHTPQTDITRILPGNCRPLSSLPLIFFLPLFFISSFLAV